MYHGKVGCGLSVEVSVRNGPVTLLSIAQTVDGRLKLVVVEAVSEPGPILEIGNTNSRYRFDLGARNFHLCMERTRPRPPLRHRRGTHFEQAPEVVRAA